MNKVASLKSNNLHRTLQLGEMEKILAYENADVISKFTSQWDISNEDAREIFKDTIKFLYLSGYGQVHCKPIEVQESIAVIDEMWHAFILFSDDYHKFTHDAFGSYLHHFPFTRNRISSVEPNEDIKKVKLKDQLELVQSLFGEDTFRRWYVEYPQRYSIENLNKLRKPLRHFSDKNEKLAEVCKSLESADIADIIKQLSNFTITASCGCSGTGCGAGCSCNSGSSMTN